MFIETARPADLINATLDMSCLESGRLPVTLRDVWVPDLLREIDSETQGFLDVLSESVASAKLLLLTNYRPEYRHEWGQKTYYTQLRLGAVGTRRGGRIFG